MSIDSLSEIMNETVTRLRLTERTFHVSQANAGILGFGTKIQILNGDEIVDETIVNGFTLENIRRHTEAQASGDIDKIIETNRKLPKRFRINL